MTALAASLPFFVVCPTCNARRYDEGNRRHVTVLLDGEFPRYVCLDVVVPQDVDAGDMDRVLDALSAKLLGRVTGDTGDHFVRAS